MTRLLVHVEGETEERFVNQVLAPHLYGFKYSGVSARLMGNTRQWSKRGGIRAWTTVRKGIMNHLRQDSGCIVTTMVDYYGMPKSWPRRMEAGKLTFPQNVQTVENALATDVSEQMPTNFNPDRFVPYVMMHEFEAMLFSDCKRFADGIGHPKQASAFQAIRNQFATPEEINDFPETAPSKRIELLVPGYQKPLLGALASSKIGLNTIRSACPHFRSWLTRLESIPTSLDV